MAIPNKMAKKITCNILLLSDAADRKLDGTMSTTNCRGPSSFTLVAASILAPALEAYFSFNSMRFSCEKVFPGCTKLTKNKPIVTATTVDAK